MSSISKKDDDPREFPPFCLVTLCEMQRLFRSCPYTSKLDMNKQKEPLSKHIMHFVPKINLKTHKLSNLICKEMRSYLRIEEGAKNCNGSSNSIDGLDRCVKDYDG